MKPASHAPRPSTLAEGHRLPSSVDGTVSSSELSEGSKALLETARQTRRSAQAFARTVHRFSTEMPGHLDRFHEAMLAFRRTASSLNHLSK